VACVAIHLAVAVEALFVDGHRHLDHAARGGLGGLIVLLELTQNVAVGALHTERRGYEFHGRLELRRGDTFEHLNVLKNLLGKGRPLRCGLRLRRLLRRNLLLLRRQCCG